LIKVGGDTEPARTNGRCIEAVVENLSGADVSAGALKIYFAGGAYCQISSAGERGFGCGVAWTALHKAMITFSGILGSFC
jgi:hypothetical protein